MYAAFSAFQGELKAFAKTKHVSFPKKNGGGNVEFDFTPLGDIFEEIYPMLGRHGLSARHEMVYGDKSGITAILTHETAKWVERKKSTQADGSAEFDYFLEGEIKSGIVPISTAGEMRDTGAAITYARRYSLAMLLGIVSEDDNDIEQLAENAQAAVNYVFTKTKKSLDDATDAAAVEKTVKILKKDLKDLEAKKTPALGLTKDQYEGLIAHGEVRIRQITEGLTPAAAAGDGVDAPAPEEETTEQA